MFLYIESTTEALTLHSIPKRAHFAKQSVLLDGTGNEHFSEDIRAIRLIHQKLSANYKEGALKEWGGTEGQDGTIHTHEYGARYFTPKQFVNGELPIPFSSTVDPYGHLSRAGSSNLVHLPGNDVAYYQHIPMHRRQPR